MLVFGVMTRVHSPASLFFTEVCKSCTVGLSTLIIGLRPATSATKLDLVFTYGIPQTGFRAQGQIIGAHNYLIANLVNDEDRGLISAILHL